LQQGDWPYPFAQACPISVTSIHENCGCLQREERVRMLQS
jgi:hypothetical protein